MYSETSGVILYSGSSRKGSPGLGHGAHGHEAVAVAATGFREALIAILTAACQYVAATATPSSRQRLLHRRLGEHAHIMSNKVQT